MIQSLEEFVEYSKTRAAEYERDPELKKHAETKLLKTPGYSENIITRIGKSSRVMLDSYYELLRKVQVRCVEYCSVFFSPAMPYKDYDIAIDLSSANHGDYRAPTEEFTSDALYCIAAWGRDSIYVVHQPNEKQINIGAIILDIRHKGCCNLFPLAESFEKFLILIGNLDQIKVKHPDVADDETNEEICEEFLVRLKKLHPDLSSEMVASWEHKLRPVDVDPRISRLKRDFVKFEYFHGPVEDMSGLTKEVCQCSLCGEAGLCFDLEFATCDDLGEETEGKVGCATCLTAGKFEFSRDTDIGFLDEDGLDEEDEHNKRGQAKFLKSALSSLRRTPEYYTCQEGVWLSHCNDFMVYQGRWQPKDFHKNAPDGDGRALFLEMAADEENHLWEDSIPPGETELDEWFADSMYYVFKCKHCGIFKGNWDCD